MTPTTVDNNGPTRAAAPRPAAPPAPTAAALSARAEAVRVSVSGVTPSTRAAPAPRARGRLRTATAPQPDGARLAAPPPTELHSSKNGYVAKGPETPRPATSADAGGSAATSQTAANASAPDSAYARRPGGEAQTSDPATATLTPPRARRLAQGADGRIYIVAEENGGGRAAQGQKSRPAAVSDTIERRQRRDAVRRQRDNQRTQQQQTGGRQTTAESEQIEQLRARDREVRQHERAHIAMAGGYAVGSPSYSYQVGPDGRIYVTGGKVQLDTSPEATPERTIRKMEVVRRAASAPIDISMKDAQAAATALRTEMRARAQIAQRYHEFAPPEYPPEHTEPQQQRLQSTGPAVTES